MKTHKAPMLDVRTCKNMLDVRIAQPISSKTLKQRQQETGRTLALNGQAWRKLRTVVLSEHPFCELCGKPATDVDHADNDPTNNSRDNLASLCHECHSRKTQADMGKRIKYGCDANGNPLDPSHHWNKKSRATKGNEPAGTLHARDRENKAQP